MNRSFVRAFHHATLAALIGLAAACGEDGALPTGAEGIVFLVESKVPPSYRQALFQGVVFQDGQGCLRLQSSEPATVVWPFGSRLASRDGQLYVVDDDGDQLAKIGGESRFGGGYTAPDHEYLSRRDRAILADRCPGEIWIATPIRS